MPLQNSLGLDLPDCCCGSLQGGGRCHTQWASLEVFHKLVFVFHAAVFANRNTLASGLHGFFAHFVALTGR